jgi:hypothetical protein
MLTSYILVSLALMYLVNHAHNDPEASPPVSCAILFSRAFSHDPVTWHSTGLMQKLESVPHGRQRIEIPVANIWGVNDWEDVLGDGPATANFFDELGYWSFVHPGGHELPMREALKKTAKIAKKAIMQAQSAAESSTIGKTALAMAPHLESDLQPNDTVKPSSENPQVGTGKLNGVMGHGNSDQSFDQSPEPLAIIGLAFQFPGGADTEDKFWDLLLEQKNVSSGFPKDRINIDAFHSDDPKKRATVSAPQTQ